MNTTSKHLAAILFTDIVGYTKLMGSDESKTLQLVQKNRELQMPIVERHNGKWIKEMGDGTMAQIDTALDAVNCAVEIQRTARIHFEAQIRIGIHLGDLIFDHDDVYGDGVNIASRLESQATPGGIYISDTIYNIIKGKGDFYFKDVGDLKLKNVSEPVHTFSIIERNEAELLNKKHKSAARNKSIVYTVLILILISAFFWGKENQIFQSDAEKPVITVLPFELIEGNEDDKYLSDGLSEELIRNLGKVKSLYVTNALSTKQYLSTAQPLFSDNDQMRSESYIVKGKYYKQGFSITIDISLLDNRDSELLSKSYTEDVANLPRLFGSMAIDISEAININLNQDTKQHLTEIASINPRIYELILKGNTIIGKYVFRDMDKSLVYFKQATDEFPGEARAWAGMAEGLVDLGHSPAATQNTWIEAKSAAIRAIQLDSTLAEAWAALAHVKTYFEWDYEGAEVCYYKANELNPNLAMNHYHYAWHSFLMDRMDVAIAEHKLAQKLDPFSPMHTNWLVYLLLEDGQIEEARKEVKRSLRISKDNPLGYYQFGRLLMAEGKKDSALIMYKKAGVGYPGVKWMGECQYYMEIGNYEAGMECIEEIKSSPLTPYKALRLATLYAAIDSLDQYFKYINYEPAHAWAPWQRVMQKHPKVINDPRFKELMDKMNLPMPKEKSPDLIAKK